MKTTSGAVKSMVATYFFLIWRDLILYLQFLYIPIVMDWHLNNAQDGILLGGSVQGAFPRSFRKHIVGLFLGSLKKDCPLGETPVIALTFLH